MLDLKALHEKLKELGEDLGSQAQDHQARVAAAIALLNRADNLADRLEEYDALADKPWRLAIPAAGVADAFPLPAFSGPHTVVATDGSQITPSHHEIALCCLINIGRILYTYGTGELPLQASLPYLHHGEELRPKVGDRRQAMTEELLALKRNQRESAALVELAWLAVNRAHPAMALVDGTLIQFMLEKNDLQRDEFLRSHLDDLEQLRLLRVPVAGYLSNSRSADVVNLLRLVACPKEALNCSTCALHEPPCEERHLPLHDRRVWAQRLAPGERSPLFLSSSPILRYYDDQHKIFFFYLHVGSEVARLEVPRWVAEDRELLDRVHALAYDQAQKGMGYPITLQEAHNQAVVSREDRARFFALLSQRMAAAGVTVAVSHKQLKKRAGVV
jgi:hypothetical protein